MSEQKKYVIALYIRLSIEDYKVDSLSIQNQQLTLHKYVEFLPENNNAQILEFIDNGYSGTNFERPAVQELLDMVRKNQIDCIVVKDFSRFGRNAIDTGYFIEQVFPVYQTRFISVNDFFDSKDFKEDTGGLEAAFKYLINEYYSQDLSRKSKSAKYIKMQRGEYISKECCYGYKKGTNRRLAIDEETAPIVRLIFQLALEKKNTNQIIEALYKRKIPTPGEHKASKGRKIHDVSRCRNIWQKATILRILRDERYIGTYVMGKQTRMDVGSKKMCWRDEKDWFKIPDHHPAIITKEVFEQVQENFPRLKSNKKKINYYSLRGKVVCGCCYHAMQRTECGPKFFCYYTKVDISAPCYNLSIKEQDLEEMLFSIISKQAEVLLNLERLEAAGKLEFQISEQVEYENQIKRCQDRKRQLYEQYLLKEIELDDFMNQKALEDTELTKLKQLHTMMVERTKQIQRDDEESLKLLQTAREIKVHTALTKELADLLIEKVYVYPNNQLEILWKIKDFCTV